MEILIRKIDFYKVDKDSTYERLLEVLGKDFAICLDYKIYATGKVLDDKIALFFQHKMSAVFSKNNFKVKQTGEGFIIEFEVFNTNHDSFRMQFSNLAVIKAGTQYTSYLSTEDLERIVDLPMIYKYENGSVRTLPLQFIQIYL